MRQCDEISEAELLQWEKFPSFIRNDRCFSSYQTKTKNNFDEESSLVGENQNVIFSSSSSYTNWTSLKHFLFAAVWVIAAWHLLTVEEKTLSKFDIAINAKHPYQGKTKVKSNDKKY